MNIYSFIQWVTSCEWKLLSCVWLFETPMDYTVHGILQVRILEWIAFPFSRGSHQPRYQIQVSHIAGRFFTSWATREAQEYWSGLAISSPVELPRDPGIQLLSPLFPSALQHYLVPIPHCWKKGRSYNYIN